MGDGLDISTAVNKCAGQQVVAPVNITTTGNCQIRRLSHALPNGAYALTCVRVLSGR